MKRIFLAAGLGLGVLTFTMAGTANHPTAPQVHQLKNDTVPSDTSSPTPKTDTTTHIVNH